MKTENETGNPDASTATAPERSDRDFQIAASPHPHFCNIERETRRENGVTHIRTVSATGPATFTLDVTIDPKGALHLHDIPPRIFDALPDAARPVADRRHAPRLLEAPLGVFFHRAVVDDSEALASIDAILAGLAPGDVERIVGRLAADHGVALETDDATTDGEPPFWAIPEEC